MFTIQIGLSRDHFFLQRLRWYPLLSNADLFHRPASSTVSSKRNEILVHGTCYSLHLIFQTLLGYLRHENLDHKPDGAGRNRVMGSYQKAYRSMEPRMPSLLEHRSGNDFRKIREYEATVSRPTWRHLFAFTTSNHAALLVLAVLAAASVAAAKTTYSIFLGKVMDIIAPLGAGIISKEAALTDVSHWCMILAAMGAANWAANSIFMATWALFGELLARTARQTLFANLLQQDLAWFDSQSQGIRSILSRIQM